MISSKVFNGDGTTSRFLADFIIRSEQFARPYVYIYDNSLPADGSGDKLVDGTTDQANWSYPNNIWKRGQNVPQSADVVSVDKWDVVDNGVLFYDAPIATSTVWIEVATTSEEFGTTLVLPNLEAAETAAASSIAAAGDSATSAAAALASETAAAASAASIASQDAQITQNTTDIATNTATKVSKSGDTMTGQLKGITPVSSEDLTRKDYVDGQDIGVGQTWTDVKASRVAGTTYTNSTGKPIVVSVSGSSSAGADELKILIDSTIVIEGPTAVTTGDISHVTAIIPNGSTYSVSFFGTETISKWNELR